MYQYTLIILENVFLLCMYHSVFLTEHFCFQVPMVPLGKPDEMPIPSEVCLVNTSNYEDGSCEHGIPTMITWSFGGKEVALEGSWDNWKLK